MRRAVESRKLRVESLAAFLFVFLLASGAPQRAAAQFLGYTSPQTVGPTRVFNAVIAAGTSATVQNLGQSVHFLTYTLTGGTGGPIQLFLEGSADGATYFRISNIAADPTSGIVFANGYWPLVRANLRIFAPGGANPALTAYYTGTSVSPMPPAGENVASQSFTKDVILGPLNAIQTVRISSPVGHTGGILLASRTGVPGACAGVGRLEIDPMVIGPDAAAPVQMSGNLFVGRINLGVITPQSFSIPPLPAQILYLHYIPTDLCAQNLEIVYTFDSQEVTRNHEFVLFDTRAAAGIFAYDAAVAYWPVTATRPEKHTVQLTVTGGPANCSFQLEGSLDNLTWFALSGAVDCTVAANCMFHVVNKPVNFIRGNLTALAGGAAPTVTFEYLGAR